jgi:coenzyme F420-dependent glucose-6-phosphate dehydrogenase
MQIGYHASHEQYSPSELLTLVQEAEAAGFDAIMASDHFSPFSLRQGNSGYVWSWLGAAMAKTQVGFGTVNAPGQRYHPAIVAQGIATLAEMFPGRFWVALGSGQFINERVTGESWPSEPDRDKRLGESARVIRALLHGETVTSDGMVRVQEARIFSRPTAIPLLFGAAITPETAAWIASWADGMVTVVQPRDKMADVVEAFRKHGGDGKLIYLQAQVSFDETYDLALDGAYDQWRMSVLSSDEIVNARTPEEVDRLSEKVSREEVADRVRVSADPEEHMAWLEEDKAMGFDAIYIHNVNRNQRPFITTFGSKVLPALRQAR